MKQIIWLLVALCLLAPVSATTITHTPIVFNEPFVSGTIIYTDWINVKIVNPNVNSTATIKVYGTNTYPDRSMAITECRNYTKTKMVCENVPKTYTRIVRIRTGKTYHNETRIYTIMTRVCHKETITELKCRKIYTAICPTSNMYAPINMAYTTDGANWYSLSYKPNAATLGTIINNQTLNVKFMAFIPNVCYGVYHIEKSIMIG